MSQAYRRQQAAQDADGDQGDQGAERCCRSDIRALQEQMALSGETQFYRPRPGQRMTTQPAGLNSNQGEMLGGTSIGEEQILNRGLLASFSQGQFNQGDQIEHCSCPGDMGGPQQEWGPQGEKQDFHKSPAHTPQPTGLNSHQQQMLDGMTSGGGQLTQGHQGPRQQQCQVASDGNQGLDSKLYFAGPCTRITGDQREGKTLLPHRTIGQPPIWVHFKQYDCFLRRRAFRERMGGNTQIPRKPYMHESRHKFAKTRPRDIGGQFSKKLVEGEVIAKDASKGHSKFSSHSHRLEHSNQGVMAQDSGQGLQNHGGLPNFQNTLVQDSNQGLHDLHHGGLPNSLSNMVVQYLGLGLRDGGLWNSSPESERSGLQSTMLVQDSSQGLQNGPLWNSDLPNHFGQPGINIQDANHSLQDGGFLSSQSMLVQNSSQGLQDGRLSNSPEWERSELCQSNMMAQDSSQGLQTGRLSNSYPLTSFGQGTNVQGSKHSSQSDEGFSNSQSRLVRYM